MMRLLFESETAQRLNLDSFETIYFAACEASCELAAQDGPYETFAGSPASKGQLQFDLHGLRNSLLVAPMPTASTAQILGNNESFEPYTQNLYVRRVLSGEFVQVNRHLLRDLVREACGKTYSEVSAFVENESFPIVVKPIESCGSDGVKICRTTNEVRDHVTLLMEGQRKVGGCCCG